MDDEEIEVYVKTIKPRKHDRWSVIVLTGSLVTEIIKTVADHAEAGLEALQEHRFHKIEEEKFMEIVR